jgi:cytochrome c heme-lyase
MADLANDAQAQGCPLDDEARATWLHLNARTSGTTSNTAMDAKATSPAAEVKPVTSHRSFSNLFMPGDLRRRAEIQARASCAPAPQLATSRVISSIPRAVPSTSTAKTSGSAANHEVESGADESGNWVYPSQKMFYDAMARKKHDPRAADMATVVPIHNAVNEQAWRLILAWEAAYATRDACDGPKLESFKGDSKALTPKARAKTLMGYSRPFDRHDWVIDRCGKRIDYVIDFYKGKSEGSKTPLSFYLDVRPKLNSWEGCRMRASKLLGLI